MDVKGKDIVVFHLRLLLNTVGIKASEIQADDTYIIATLNKYPTLELVSISTWPSSKKSSRLSKCWSESRSHVPSNRMQSTSRTLAPSRHSISISWWLSRTLLTLAESWPTIFSWSECSMSTRCMSRFQNLRPPRPLTLWLMHTAYHRVFLFYSISLLYLYLLFYLIHL